MNGSVQLGKVSLGAPSKAPHFSPAVLQPPFEWDTFSLYLADEETEVREVTFLDLVSQLAGRGPRTQMQATGGWPEYTSTPQASSLRKALALSESGSKLKTLRLGRVAPAVWVAGGTSGNEGRMAGEGLLESVCGGFSVGEMLSVAVHCGCICVCISLCICLYICLSLSLCISISVSLWYLGLCISVCQSVFLCLRLVSLSLHGQNNHNPSLPLAPVGRKPFSG